MDETNVTQTGGLKSDSTREEYQGIIVLGEKLTNAYSVTNMQAAYTQLKSKKGDSVPTVRVTCTHWYVKLIPRNAAELELLKKDTSLVLFDFPLDYKITRMGSYYHDPAVPDTVPTYYYTTIPAGYTLPAVKYDILEYLFYPHLYVNTDSRFDKETFDDDMALLECEALLCAKNITTDEYNKAISGVKGRKRPSGDIKVYNTITQQAEGVMGIKVRVFSGCRYECKTTDVNGHYQMSNKYLFSLWYAVKGENNIGFKLWDHLFNIDEAVYHMGNWGNGGHSFTAYTNSEAWEWFTANNAVVDYFNYCTTYGITKPPTNLRVMLIQMDSYGNGEYKGSASMIRRTWGLYGFTSTAKVKNFYFKMGGLNLEGNRLEIISKLMQPDITMQVNRNKVGTKPLYSGMFHECAHASHWQKAGNNYWVKYINYIITYGAYGDGSGQNSGICGVGEMWGNYFGSYVLTMAKFGSPLSSWDPGEDWYNPGFLVYAYSSNYAPDLTYAKIYSCLNATSISDLKANLKNQTIYKTKIDEAYGKYNDWP